MVSAPCGAEGSAGGGGSGELGSITGMGSGGSTLICDGAGFFAVSSVAVAAKTDATGTRAISFALSTQPSVVSKAEAS